MALFGLHAEMHRFAKEDARSRVSRDVFVYDARTMAFLVIPWKGDGHRADSMYGNAFGTFLYRPPKNVADMEAQRRWPEVSVEGVRGKVFRFDVSEGVVGHKTDAMNRLLGRPFRYEDATFECVVVPSAAESRTSVLSASLTVLAYFLPVDRREVGTPKGFKWLSERDATDPARNVHAGVVSTFLHRRRVGDLKTFRGDDVRRIAARLARR